MKMGLEDRSVSDDQITASSYKAEKEPKEARLDSRPDSKEVVTSWQPEEDTEGQWLQVIYSDQPFGLKIH